MNDASCSRRHGLYENPPWTADKAMRPHAMMLTKTTASYDAAFKKYNDDVKSLETIAQLEAMFRSSSVAKAVSPTKPKRKRKET